MAEQVQKTVRDLLAAPFPASHVKMKPVDVRASEKSTTGFVALALPYVDGREIMERLDSVLGVDGWEDKYEFLPSGSVLCSLRCRINGDWVTKQDVGSRGFKMVRGEGKAGGDVKDEIEVDKSAVSDALKRAAVKYGVGRYLYAIKKSWRPYDKQYKRWADATDGNRDGGAPQQPQQPQQQPPPQQQAPAPPAQPPPQQQPSPPAAAPAPAPQTPHQQPAPTPSKNGDRSAERVNANELGYLDKLLTRMKYTYSSLKVTLEKKYGTGDPTQLTVANFRDLRDKMIALAVRSKIDVADLVVPDDGGNIPL